MGQPSSSNARRWMVVVLDVAGGWSGAAYGSITLHTRPVPAAPGGVSAQWNNGFAGGGSIRGYFNGSSWATSYEFGGNFNFNGSLSGWTSTVRSSSGYAIVANCSAGTTMTGGQFRVRAGNSSGWSGYVTVGASKNTSIPACN